MAVTKQRKETQKDQRRVLPHSCSSPPPVNLYPRLLFHTVHFCHGAGSVAPGRGLAARQFAAERGRRAGDGGAAADVRTGVGVPGGAGV